jgi:hypothetical protein
MTGTNFKVPVLSSLLAGPIDEVDFGTQHLRVGGGLPVHSVL